MAMACSDDCSLDDPLPILPPRGWSMRRGHRRAIEARIIRKEIPSEARWNPPSLASAGLGRSAVKRSVNRSSRRFEKQDMGKSRKLRSAQLREEVTDGCMQHHRAQDQQRVSIVEAVVADIHLETYLSFEHLAPLAEVRKESSKEVDDFEVASTCTTATGSESDSDISMHLHMQSCRSLWEAAVLRARVVASCYKADAVKRLEESKKDKTKKVVLSPEEKYLAALSAEYSVRFSYDLKEVPTCKFEKFRSEFFYKNASHFLRQLQPLYSPGSAVWNLRPAPVSQWVQKKFLENLAAKGKDKSMMAFHGTNQSALRSIYYDGLVVPGLDNTVKVANGSAYGVGIYAGKADCATISWSYARGESKPMLVCAAWDGPAEEVYNGSSFHVFKTNHSVVPLFEATLPGPQERVPGVSVPPVTRLVVRKRVGVTDVKKAKGPGPMTRIPGFKLRPVVATFLSRRAASKRRGTSWCG